MAPRSRAAVLLLLIALTTASAAVFDVTQYGARGDGESDDTAAVRFVLSPPENLCFHQVRRWCATHGAHRAADPIRVRARTIQGTRTASQTQRVASATARRASGRAHPAPQRRGPGT